ncbi:septation protein SepH [Isoptericola sp. b490]|uniref:septation protein SepH n=1 Tax=Actinotalea lenta TaxID=3064654 RepID=UPI002712E3CE|nr:septation protein SepH [Isoptericola sp. b490]MDO8120410.1 septation protein SepH [Isoptericola sp. b490]
MSELRLVGLDEDGGSVVLEGPNGQRFTLPIDDALRAAVRRDRPQLEQVRAQAASSMPPREIQARIRAGVSADDVAEAAGVPVEIVRRYEGPVLAERDWVTRQARESRIGHESDAPALGDLAEDRLATRGVDPATVGWDAFRDASGPWSVLLRFVVGDEARTARWSFDLGARTLRAVDDEARWLSETELPDGVVPRRHLSAVRHREPPAGPDTDVSMALRPVLAAVDREPEEPEDPEEENALDSTEALLADLRGRRGVRQPFDPDAEDDGDDFEGFGPQHAFDFEHPGLTMPPAAHPADSRPQEAVDATVLEIPRRGDHVPEPADRAEPDEPTAASDGPTASAPSPSRSPEDTGRQSEPRPRRPRGRKGRASVPSWDEIVFGAKPE